jgi:quinolinate synthase
MMVVLPTRSAATILKRVSSTKQIYAVNVAYERLSLCYSIENPMYCLQRRLRSHQQQRYHHSLLIKSRWYSTSPSLVHDSDPQFTGNISHKSFPSLILGANGSITASGSFAEAQKVFLQPDIESVKYLTQLLQSTQTGIVAHYYMDVELQGVLQAVAKQLPGRIGVADSLKMGDMAVDMVVPKHEASDEAAESSCNQIICLGVDFMSESVAAILQRNGYPSVPVYRAARAKIGCSLAESAETDTYRAWLQTERDQTDRPLLHVVYINTSLETKAVSNSLVPTITCTSSNVLQTILTAAIQIPNVKILYGPDTYMGENLITFLTVLEKSWTDDQIRNDLHPQHNKESLRRLRDSIVVYPSGNCIVHHMFGASVVQTVKQSYNDAYVTAHLEVPGEMFDIAMHKSLSDDGVCGSTSDILKFIARKVREAATSTVVEVPNATTSKEQRLQFILGTEAGMVTSIVASVQSILHETENTGITAEIIFPVASEAVMATNDDDHNGLAVVPGVSGGEGCSTAGGCATCPFMKMNSLDALTDLLELIQKNQSQSNPTSELRLQQHLPPDRLFGKYISGRLATDLGTEPIVYMREFNRTKQIPTDLVQRVMTRNNL